MARPLVISSVPDDAAWAEWVGYRVQAVLDRESVPPPPPIAIVSWVYLKSERWQELPEGAVGVLIEPCEVPPNVSRSVSLYEFDDEERAAGALLAYLELPFVEATWGPTFPGRSPVIEIADATVYWPARDHQEELEDLEKVGWLPVFDSVEKAEAASAEQERTGLVIWRGRFGRLRLLDVGAEAIDDGPDLESKLATARQLGVDGLALNNSGWSSQPWILLPSARSVLVEAERVWIAPQSGREQRKQPGPPAPARKKSAVRARRPPRRGSWLPSYANDGTEGDDRLGVTHDVEVLASLIAAHQVTPPLSIGLFGDWGSGKTFFMELLRKRIDTLAGDSQSAEKEARQTLFCSHVRQISFNAWHYSDANLWASLVSELFRQLANPGGAATEDAEAVRRAHQAILDKLELAGEERTQITREQEEAERERAELDERLRFLRAEGRRTGVVDRIERLAAAVRDDPAFTRSLTDLVDRLGLRAFTPQEVRDTAQALGGTIDTVRWYRLNLTDAARRGRRLRTVVTVLGAAAAAPLVAQLPLSRVGDWIASAMPLAVAVTTVAGRGLAHATRARRLVEAGRSAWERADTHLRTVEEQERQHVNDRVAELERRRETVDRREIDARRELESLNAGRRLYDFIVERSGSADYRQHLGIISTIRRDFERLEVLLDRGREEGKAEGIPQLDRIVLYIDDLDRCPPERVVEVLQAVHLLMALKLFVVVVGVDSRWLLRALRRHLGPMLGEGEQDNDHWSATPQNYLEKIFQIPYALRPMTISGYGQLVESLTGSADGKVPAAATAPAPTAAQDRPAPIVTQRPASTIPASSSTAPPAGVAANPQPPPVNLTPEGLTIGPDETAYLARLGELVPNPRAAKRLVNLYRLVCVSASSDELDRLREGEYAAVLVLLGLLVGFPTLAEEVFLKIEAAPRSKSLRTVLTELRQSHPETDAAWDRLFDALEDTLKIKETPKRVGDYRDWIRRVARYSFQTSRIRFDEEER